MLANPWYLELLKAPPSGGGWDVTPLLSALVTALGIVWGLIGVVSLLGITNGRHVQDLALGIAVATIIGVRLHQVILRPHFDVAETRVFGYGEQKSFVAAFVAAAFVYGVGKAEADRRLVAVGAILPILVWVFTMPLRPPTLPLLVFFLLTLSTRLLGFSGVGLFGLILAAVSGFVFGRSGEDSESSVPFGESGPFGGASDR